ncbi:MAG: prolyl-tRNA synthetase associated domain-containing protein [Clostridia bacterium]|nr:prolyl-tRNA synthetase associated domain-containing protein [Clostridia bacterium]
MSHKAEVIAMLGELNIPCAIYEHEAAHTMEDCLALPYATPEVTFCKNILLCNRQLTDFYLLVMPPCKAFRTSEVSKRLGSSRLSFAPAEVMREMLGVESGSLSPMAVWFDRCKQVKLVFDGEVRRAGKIAFHPCDNTATVVFEQEVFWQQVVPALGKEPIWI